jgi:hypothetical protein
MKFLLWCLALVIFLLWALIASAQLYPSQPPLLGPIQRDAYGPQSSKIKRKILCFYRYYEDG